MLRISCPSTTPSLKCEWELGGTSECGCLIDSTTPSRFIEVQFSKSPEKYIKYRPEDLSNMLNSLFDDTV